MSSRSPAASRGAPVVDAIYEATFEELARVGYGGFSREEVAARAGVNKSTVYRRWETTAELVIAAFESAKHELVTTVPESESLRTDLQHYVVAMGRLGENPSGRAAMRLFLFEAVQSPELMPVTAMLKQEEDARGLNRIVDRAILRGELPVGTKSRTLVDTIRGAIVHRILMPGRGKVDAMFARELIGIVLDGTLPKTGPTKAKASRAS